MNSNSRQNQDSKLSPFEYSNKLISFFYAKQFLCNKNLTPQMVITIKRYDKFSVINNLCLKENFDPIFPPLDLCGDNAAMIAMVGLEKFKLKQFSNLDFPAKPRWPLDENASFLKGAGVKI